MNKIHENRYQICEEAMNGMALQTLQSTNRKYNYCLILNDNDNYTTSLSKKDRPFDILWSSRPSSDHRVLLFSYCSTCYYLCMIIVVNCDDANPKSTINKWPECSLVKVVLKAFSNQKFNLLRLIIWYPLPCSLS